MSNNGKAFKSALWYTVANFMTKSISFVTTPIFTRLLTKAEFGAYNNYISWLSIITIFVTLNLESTFISAKFDFGEKFDEYILSVLSLSSLSVCFWMLVINIFKTPAADFLDLNQLYINMMLIYLFFLPAIHFFQTRQRYYYEYKKTVLSSLTLSIGTAVTSVLLVLNMKNRLDGRILGSVIPVVVLGLLFYIYFIKKGKKVNLQYWKYALPICLPYIPHLLSMTFLNSTDRVMINHWCGREDTALYSLAYSCGAIVTVLLTSINNAYAPWLGEKITQNSLSEVKEFSKVYILGFVFLAVGIMLVSPEILMIMGGKQYQEAMYVMAPVSMGCICQFLYTMFVNIEQIKKKTVGMAIASAIAAAVNLFLNYIFIPQYGYLAAAYTTLVGYLVLLVIHMYLVYRLKLNHVYNYKFVIEAVVVSIILMILITLSYKNMAIRYGALIIYLIALIQLIIKYKNEFIKVINSRK